MKHQYVDSAIQDIDSSYNATNICLLPYFQYETIYLLIKFNVSHYRTYFLKKIQINFKKIECD